MANFSEKNGDTPHNEPQFSTSPVFMTKFRQFNRHAAAMGGRLATIVNTRCKSIGGNQKKMLIAVSCVMGALIALVFLKIVTHTSIVKLPTLVEQKAGIEIYDRNDKLVTVVQENGDHQPIAIGLMSPFIKQAVIGIEDHNFYHHMGVDPLGITRAMYKNAMARQMIEGGSTITQQLMKTMFFGPDDRTARRKILEMFMALDVETCYSKDKILETYLNEVYFGRGAYGIQRAAYTFFNKPASKLTLPEAAYLAALVKAPSELGQASKLKKAQARQREVLNGMVECGFISSAQAEDARNAKLNFKAGPHSRRYPHYVNHVIGMMKDEFGEDKLFSKPMKVYTNLDSSAQQAAETALSKGVLKAPAGIDQGALVSIDLETGGIIALVGGVGDFTRHQFNRATNPHTAGSAFKPFVYLAGLITGTIGPNSFVNDAPIAIPLSNGTSYTPQNYDGEYKGLMTVREALALSRNVCAVQVGQETGIDNVIKTAHKAGITSELQEVPSLALGTCAVSPLEMANAYATIARGGEYVEPLFIRHINDEKGKLIESFESKRETRLPAEATYELVDSMEDVVSVGTGKRARIPGVPVAGKTGTADDSKDVWFVGFTPDVVTAVWAGNDQNDAPRAKGITGGTIAAGIWSNYMTTFYKSHPKPDVAFIDPEHPLTHALPFFAYLPGPLSDATEQVVDAAEQIVDTTGHVANAIQSIADPPKAASKKPHKSFFKKLADGFRHLF